MGIANVCMKVNKKVNEAATKLADKELKRDANNVIDSYRALRGMKPEETDENIRAYTDIVEKMYRDATVTVKFN